MNSRFVSLKTTPNIEELPSFLKFICADCRGLTVPDFVWASHHMNDKLNQQKEFNDHVLKRLDEMLAAINSVNTISDDAIDGQNNITSAINMIRNKFPKLHHEITKQSVELTT